MEETWVKVCEGNFSLTSRLIKDRLVEKSGECVENGIKPEEVPVSAILQGYQLAFPRVKLGGELI